MAGYPNRALVRTLCGAHLLPDVVLPWQRAGFFAPTVNPGEGRLALTSTADQVAVTSESDVL
jgi:hypothetical protein